MFAFDMATLNHYVVSRYAIVVLHRTYFHFSKALNLEIGLREAHTESASQAGEEDA